MCTEERKHGIERACGVKNVQCNVVYQPAWKLPIHSAVQGDHTTRAISSRQKRRKGRV